MTIEQRVATTIEAWTPREPKSESLVHLETFYAQMKEKGLIRRNEYTLPPLDTVGREAYAGTQLRITQAARTRG